MKAAEDKINSLLKRETDRAAKNSPIRVSKKKMFAGLASTKKAKPEEKSDILNIEIMTEEKSDIVNVEIMKLRTDLRKN